MMRVSIVSRSSQGVLAVLTLAVLAACGGGGSSPTAPAAPPVTAPPPDAAVTATGAGALILHPSALPAWAVALETPIRIQETGGGEADWNYARFSLYSKGVEIERGELGSDVIRNAGSGRITARSNAVYKLAFRFNSAEFDDIRITLGFADIRTGRQFTTTVPLSSFTDVQVSFTPLSLPAPHVVKLD